MKIYFNGCSWTYGCELDNPQQERFSKLICDHFGAEETNLAVQGGSNDKIVRELLTQTDITQYDLGVIQMTHPSRTEFYSKRCWISMNIGQNYRSWNLKETEKNFLSCFSWWNWGEKTEMDIMKNAWKEYYMHIVTDEFLYNKELIHNLTIRNHFKSKNIPLVLLTINHKTNIPEHFDISLVNNKPYSLAPGGHPNKEGHHMIFQEIVNYIKDENLL
jgi:hypothetical protein